MKLTTPLDSNLDKAEEIIAFFGSAQIVRRPDGLYELLGGTADDRDTFRNWCRHFTPEVGFGTTGEA